MKKNILPKLRTSVSQYCQLRCNFCGGQLNNMENFQPEDMKGLLNTKRLIEIYKQYIAHGGAYIQFTGGEPLLREDIEDLVYQTRQIGGIPEINTNGYVLTRQKAIQLKESGLNVIKVSIPAFGVQEYKNVTNVDAYQRVMDNISNVIDVLQLRVNMVATKKNLDNIENIIKICKQNGIKQILLLELLYYPSVQSSFEDFLLQHVDVVEKYGKEIERILDSKFKQYRIEGTYETKLYLCEDDDIQIFVKQADFVYRIPECYQCDNMCQEGVYEMRLSTGGFLGLCNRVNKLGVDTNSLGDKQLSKVFDRYLEILNGVKDGEYKDFFEMHKKAKGLKR